MKILFDHQIFVSQKLGGVSRYFYEIANLINKVPGSKVEIFAPLYVNEYFIESSSIRPTGLMRPKRPRLTRIVNMVNDFLPRLFIRRRKDVDIFHETYYTMADNCPASARRIITVYDMIHEIFPEYFEPGLLSRFLKIKAHAINRADHVICISENTKIDLIKLLAIPEEKISVVHLGSSLIQNHHVDSVTDTGVQKPYLLFVGNRTGHKNFNRLLHAYAKFPLLRDKFQLVCFGGDVFSPDEIQLVHSLSLDTDRILHIKGGDSYLADIYASASALVYPSIYEGFGIPPLEAMLLGCPVISSNSSSLPEILGDAAEFFDPVDITAIGMAITRVVTDPERCKSLITAGQIRAQSFSWEKCAKNTLDVYQQVLSRES